MERVGVRELRQNLSVYLKRVKRGERMEVTEHGRTVAMLVPKPAPTETDDEWLERMQAEGRISRGGGNLAALGPPPPAPPGAKPLSQTLQEMRDEDPR